MRSANQGRNGLAPQGGALAVLLMTMWVLGGCGGSAQQAVASGPGDAPKVQVKLTAEEIEIQKFRNLGDQYRDSKLFDKAADQYAAALEIDETNAELWSLQGYALLQADKADLAIKAYQRYVALEPDNCDAYGSLGFAYLKHGLNDQATVQYAKALDLCPTDPNAYTNMGKAYSQAGNQIEALEAFRRAAELNPEDVKTYELIARIAWERRLYPQAIQAYEAILARPNHGKDGGWVAWANDRLGYMYQWGGAEDKAVGCFEKVLANNPKPEMQKRATRGLAVAYYKSGQTDQAIVWYSKLLKEIPDKPEYYYRVGELLVDVGRVQEAIQKVKEGQSYDQKCGAWGYYVLGEANEKLGNHRRAINNFKSAKNCNHRVYSPLAEQQVDRQEKLLKIQQLKKEKDRLGY